MLSLTLPYPPSVNHYWRYGQGRHRISAEGQAYRVWVHAMVRSMALQPLRGRLQVTVTLHARDRRRRDIAVTLFAYTVCLAAILCLGREAW